MKGIVRTEISLVNTDNGGVMGQGFIPIPSTSRHLEKTLSEIIVTMSVNITAHLVILCERLDVDPVLRYLISKGKLTWEKHASITVS